MAKTRTSPIGSDQAWRRMQDGYTLLELIVVLAVIACMSALALSAMKPMSEQRMLQIQAAKLRLEVMAARSDAVSSGMISTFTVDSGHGAWRRGRNAPQILPIGIELFLERPATSLNPRTTDSISFYPDGTSSGGVLLVKAGKTGVNIAIDWLTGYPSRAF